MADKINQETSILRNWYWVVLINLFFVGAMIQYFFVHHPAWFLQAYRAISLTHEMNYAVWWSGIYLFLAGIIFFKVGDVAQRLGRSGLAWYGVSAVMVALCVDEIGSIHESVATIAGWYGLLPFALVIGMLLCWILFELIKDRSTRLVAALIVFGLSAFVSVAGLEALEHDLTFQDHFWRRIRQVVEEAVELVGAGFFIVAGLVAMRVMGEKDRRFLNATSVIRRILDFPLAIFLLFIGHSIMVIVLMIPNYTLFPEGNPGVLLPLLLFFCMGVICWQWAIKSDDGFFLKLMSVLFIVASIMQMYNFNIFYNLVTGQTIEILIEPSNSWLVSIVPLLVIAVFAVYRYQYPLKLVLLHLLMCALIYLMLYPDIRFYQRIEFLYFLFSGAVSYSSFLILSYIYDRQENSHV